MLVDDAASLMIGSGMSSASNAAAASTMPTPHVLVVHAELTPVGNARAVDVKAVRTCAGVSVESSEYSKDATPATCGAAILVP